MVATGDILVKSTAAPGLENLCAVDASSSVVPAQVMAGLHDFQRFLIESDSPHVASRLYFILRLLFLAGAPDEGCQQAQE